VIVSLIPAMLAAFYFFGLPAVLLTVTAVVSCMVVEFVIQKYLIRGPVTVLDGSAIITGILLAFNLPSSLPLWMVVVGSVVAIGVGKMTFGGLGKNPFNPALVGRVFLMVSFPVQMTSYPVPSPLNTRLVDIVTGPTPLSLLKDGMARDVPLAEIMAQAPDYIYLLIGNIGGSLGETSALLLLIGGLFMMVRKIISWHIPVAFIGTVAVFSAILWFINPNQYASPVFHLLSGGLMLGAIYMATDMVTSPMTPLGMIIFGIGCGLITVIIRLFGAYPEGVAFSILIMNAFVPLINSGVKPRRFGKEVRNG
ncbi:MAG TPA: RnfABCDGE type electron transport complex subunit D, partial [Bacteroidales bacterium]|nr:RnfABCDGE type electron transport complex subunit D [Bacteroidales bacterium]